MSNVFDIIHTEERKMVGVIDFVNSKYVTFFDMTNVEDPSLHQLVIIYKTYYPKMRFSIFLAAFASHYDFGSPKSINKKLIRYHSRPLNSTTPERKVSRIKQRRLPLNATV